mgnify:CR=1 FL=1
MVQCIVRCSLLWQPTSLRTIRRSRFLPESSAPKSAMDPSTCLLFKPAFWLLRQQHWVGLLTFALCSTAEHVIWSPKGEMNSGLGEISSQNISELLNAIQTTHCERWACRLGQFAGVPKGWHELPWMQTLEILFSFDVIFTPSAAAWRKKAPYHLRQSHQGLLDPGLTPKRWPCHTPPNHYRCLRAWWRRLAWF